MQTSCWHCLLSLTCLFASPTVAALYTTPKRMFYSSATISVVLYRQLSSICSSCEEADMLDSYFGTFVWRLICKHLNLDFNVPTHFSKTTLVFMWHVWCEHNSDDDMLTVFCFVGFGKYFLISPILLVSDKYHKYVKSHNWLYV